METFLNKKLHRGFGDLVASSFNQVGIFNLGWDIFRSD
jgi:hypothetical protein